ncbi:Xyloglucan endotransglucosylase protein 1 [Linum grandiflorum]
MKLYSSLWNADQWATRGGLVKTDWSKAPFTAYYRNFNTKSSSYTTTKPAAGNTGGDWKTQKLDAGGRRWIKWAQKYHMIYNYCSDLKRFPHGRPRECRR